MTEERKEYNIEQLRKEFAALRKYAAIQAASEDKIGVQKIYVDMTDSIEAAFVLDELVFWTLPRENNISGLRIWRDGVLWLAVNRSEWWDRKRLTKRQADLAISKLIKQGLVIKDLFKFSGVPTVHLRLNIPVFFEKYAQALDKAHPLEAEETPVEKELADLYEMMGFPFHQSVKSISLNGDAISPNGNGTLPNGENINIPHASPTQPSHNTPSSSLKLVEENFKIGMRMMVAPWETNKKGWQSFPRWLLEQEQKGYPVERFCKWFMSDDFRAKTIGMWSPDGRKGDGLYSFKSVYLQAFDGDVDSTTAQELSSHFDNYQPRTA